jgi:hypothetical protein
MTWLRAMGLVLGCALTLALVACGGGNKESVTPNVADHENAIDDDPVALLPSGAMVLAKVDAKTMFSSGSVGGQLGQIVERVVPIGEEAGFKAARDLDLIYVGGYSMSGADVVAVLRGVFDEEKIKKVADAHTPTKGGGVIVASQYGGRSLYTLNNVGFTILSKRTVLAGTETMIRRSIDRLKDGKAVRNQPKWMLETIATTNASFAGAADFANQPVGAASVGMIPLPWVKSLKAVRLIGDFHDPGLNVAATLTYPDAQTAQTSSDDVKRTAAAANLLALLGAPKLQNLDVKPQESDVQVKFAVDDASLRQFMGTVSTYLPNK